MPAPAAQQPGAREQGPQPGVMLSISAIPALPGTCSCRRNPQSGGRGLRVTGYRANAGYKCAALTQSPRPPLPMLLGLHNRGIGPAEHAARVPAGARKRCPKAVPESGARNRGLVARVCWGSP